MYKSVLCSSLCITEHSLEDVRLSARDSLDRGDIVRHLGCCIQHSHLNVIVSLVLHGKSCLYLHIYILQASKTTSPMLLSIASPRNTTGGMNNIPSSGTSSFGVLLTAVKSIGKTTAYDWHHFILINHLVSSRCPVRKHQHPLIYQSSVSVVVVNR